MHSNVYEQFYNKKRLEITFLKAQRIHHDEMYFRENLTPGNNPFMETLCIHIF